MRHEFSSKVLRGDFKSYYADRDVRIFREYRSKARYGILDKKEKRKYQELVEIDVTKAYTSAFEKINEIPVFNEFDIWKKNNHEDIKGLSLYLVESHEGNLFFVKKVNFCFGKFIEKKTEIYEKNNRSKTSIKY